MASIYETQRTNLQPERPEDDQPHLVVLAGEDAGRMYRLSRAETIIGRSDDAHIRLSGGLVSRRHAVARLEDRRVTIEDLGSTNGTLVGVDRVKGQREVVDGEEIGIGDTVLLKLTLSSVFGEALRDARYEVASPDPSTGLATTPHLEDRIRTEHAFSRRHRTHLTIVYLRADGLGGVDSLDAIEPAMAEVSGAVRATIRPEDLLARVGVDEMIVLVRSDHLQAEVMAQQIRAKVAPPAVGGRGERPRILSVVVIPLGNCGTESPFGILVAAREEARQSIGISTNCMLVLRPLELSRRAPR